MSLKSWKREFYPIPAKKVAKRNALAHALRKWMGLLARNLTKHGLVLSDHGWGLGDGLETFSLSGYTCALCNAYSCERCPLGESACSDGINAWINHDNPSPMIALLRKAVKSKPARAAKRKKLAAEKENP